jgi:hypothetical protein
MAEVVMDDMAIGNPVSPGGPAFGALWASFPGIHIAQFRFQVIGNCGVIAFFAIMRCSIGDAFWRRCLVTAINLSCGLHSFSGPARQMAVGHAYNMTVSWQGEGRALRARWSR